MLFILSRPAWPFALLVVIFLLSGCGVASRTVVTGPAGEEAPPRAESRTAAPSRPLRAIQQELHLAHREWKGTPYRLGGNGKNGIDCSAFTQVVYRNHFNLDLPRTTRDQLRIGRGIRRNAVMPGDLIFFRTTRTDLHVGIAINREEFLHASTTMGVMISSLNERYWSDRFLGVRRILL